jgi:hypothetical protein
MKVSCGWRLSSVVCRRELNSNGGAATSDGLSLGRENTPEPGSC